jgi:hypothetical protein
MLKREKEHLDEDIAILQGLPTPKHDPNETQIRIMKDMMENVERVAQHALDAEASIELHNRIHPEEPAADLKDLLRL